jgi:Mg2+-importing ATPase
MQILLINFLTDFPAINIAGDSVDRELVEKPRRWNVKFIRDFMMIFGAVSSIFDYLTFGTLLFLHLAIDQFRTGWFLESVLTELAILLVVRTKRSFFRSKPGRCLWVASLVVAGITLILPYSPLSRLLGFTPLPISILLVLGVITALYIAASELTKKIFYQRAQF